MEQPPGFIHDSSLVYRLNNSLYVLKHAPRAWYTKIDSYLLSQKFVSYKSDPNVYMLRTIDSLIILVLYVDDIFITRCPTLSIIVVKQILHDRFLMTNMGPRIYYNGTFTPVAKMDSIILTLSIVATRGWEVHQMDAKNEFLHEDLLESIYMEQPPSFIHDSSLVYKLNNSLYVLKHAPRAWYTNIDSYLLSQKFVRYKSDPNVYMLRTIDSLIILVLYVDDIFITRCSTLSIIVVKRILHDRFLMTNMGPRIYYNGTFTPVAKMDSIILTLLLWQLEDGKSIRGM
jgi:hypothetical protein